jgi:hypothetical protein
VPPKGIDRWHLELFDERLDWWVRDMDPPQDLVILVLDWILGLKNNPFVGMSEVEGFVDYWFGPVPYTDHGAGYVVTCSFKVHRDTRVIRCDLFATLARPL